MNTTHASNLSGNGSWLSAAKSRAADLFKSLGRLKNRLERSLEAPVARKERHSGWIEQLEPRLVMSTADPVQFHIANNTGAQGLASDEIYLSMFGQVAGVGTVTFFINEAGQTVPYTLGSGATAVANVDSTTKAITSFTMATPGSGYYYVAPNVVITGGGGTGAKGQAVLGTGENEGKIVGITLIDGGSGYTSTPTVTITTDGNAPSIKLSEVLNQTLNIDNSLSIDGGRLYISNDPGTIQILGGAPTGPTTSNFANYFDYVEFALNSGSANQLVVDTSQVDAVGFPMVLYIDPPDPDFNSAGIYIDRASLFANFRSEVANASDYIFSDKVDYRILSPAQAITSAFSATTLKVASISDPQVSGEAVTTYTAKVSLPQPPSPSEAGQYPTTGALKAGMVVSGPFMPPATVIQDIIDDYTITITSSTPFTEESNLYLNFYEVPSSSLLNFFDVEIDKFFNYYTKENPLTLASVANEVYTGYTQSITKTNINGTQSDYAVLRLEGANGPFDIYYPFFTTNTPSGKTPAANGLTPIGNVVQPPPSWWAYSPEGGPQLSMYEYPSQMAFGGDGVFNDSVFQYPEASQTTEAQILGNLENQIVVAINRGYSMALNTRMGTITQTTPASDKGTVTLTSGTTDGIVPGMYFSTFPLSQMMKVLSVDATNKTIQVQSLVSESTILPINESVMHFTTFFPEGGVWNEYAQFLHQENITIGGRAYALSYDDQGGYSTTLTSNFGSTPAKVIVDLVSWSAPPVNKLPSIGGLFTDNLTYLQDTPVQITALDVLDSDGTVTQVAVYLDANFNGIIDPSDTLLGEATKDIANWSLTVTGDKFALGKNQILAQAKDNNGSLSPTAIVDIIVERRVSLGGFMPQRVTSYKYVDEQGNNVRLSISGPGMMHVYFDESQEQGGDPTRIEVVGTNERTSTLTFNVLANKKVSTSTGVTNIGNLTVEGGLRRLNAANVNLDGDLTVVGHVASLQLNDINTDGQQTVSLGGKSTQRSVIAIGKVQDLNLTSTASILSFRATEWLDKDLNTDSLTAPSISRLDITGTSTSRRTPAAGGNLEADVTVTGSSLPTGRVNLNLVNVAGDVTGDWNITGKVGLLNLNYIADTNIVASGNINRIVARNAFVQTNITSGGVIGSFITTQWEQGQITAKAINTLTVTGRNETKVAPAVQGVFVGDINVTGTGTQFAVNRLSIADMAAGKWNVTGAIGSVTVGSANKLTVASTGNIGRFNVQGQATDLSVSSKANITAIRAENWNGGAISANTVGSILITGDNPRSVTKGTRGNFAADVTILAQGISGNRPALGSAVIRGTLNDSTWRVQGNVGLLSLWEMYNSSVFVGLNLDEPELAVPNSATDFASTTATLGRFRLDSFPGGASGDSTVNSVVAASLLGRVETLKAPKTGAPPTKIQLVTLDDSKYVASTSLPSSILETIYVSLTPVVVGD